MSDRNALAALIEAVEGGSIAPFYGEFRSALGAVLRDHGVNAYDGSIDAAKTLHEALLPGWSWDLSEACAILSPPDDMPDDQYHGDVMACLLPPARAWLLAILRAIAADGDPQNTA